MRSKSNVLPNIVEFYEEIESDILFKSNVG